MIPRHLQGLLLESLHNFPVVLLVGARQVGKSTLAQAVCSEHWPARYLTLDDRTVLDAALLNPDGFVQESGWPVVIDEVQRAPDLLRAIKLVVDRQISAGDTGSRAGMFLLTGSANVVTLTKVSETLAGRVAVHELAPFSWAEISRKPVSGIIDELFSARVSGRPMLRRCS